MPNTATLTDLLKHIKDLWDTEILLEDSLGVEETTLTYVIDNLSDDFLALVGFTKENPISDTDLDVFYDEFFELDTADANAIANTVNKLLSLANNSK
jgi:hypothetical protein